MLIDLIRANRNALAKAITVVENNFDSTAQIVNAIQTHLGHAHVVGVTGPPGVGKSTLIDTCIGEFRKLGKSVAVLAIDPSSHLSGGALLGDRVRMGEHADDDQVFIRSVAARGHLGGLSATALNIVHLFDAACWDVVIVETVGTGQSEIEISEVADTTVVVASPGLGDEIQAIKAGLLEIADIVAVNKSDLPNLDLTVSELNQALALRHLTTTPPIVKTCATEQQGIGELVATINHRGDNLMQGDRQNAVLGRVRKIVARVVGQSVTKQFLDLNNETADEISRQVQCGELNPDTIAKSAVEELTSTLTKTDEQLR